MPDEAAPPIARPLVAIDEDVHCPLCDYNLRGLTQPRCPECGFTFTWDELLDQHRRMHPYLFEHHPERNAWAFFRTLQGAQRPRRFWTTLSPAQASRPRRLLAYAFAVNGVFVVLLALGWSASVAAMCIVQVRTSQQRRAVIAAEQNAPNPTPNQLRWKNYVISRHGSVQKFLDVAYPISFTRFFTDPAGWNDSFRRGGSALLTCVAILTWPWLTCLALMSFRISMRLAKIRSIHVLRCVIYNADVALWGALLAVPAIVFWRQYPAYHRWSGPTPGEIAVFSLPVFLLSAILVIWTWRLAIAYREYLRFNHPIATIIASQALVLMTWLNLSLINVWF